MITDWSLVRGHSSKIGVQLRESSKDSFHQIPGPKPQFVRTQVWEQTVYKIDIGISSMDNNLRSRYFTSSLTDVFYHKCLEWYHGPYIIYLIFYVKGSNWSENFSNYKTGLSHVEVQIRNLVTVVVVDS